MNSKMTAIAGIILKNERKNHKKISRKKYSINEIIKPDISTILPPNQKLICSNRTVLNSAIIPPLFIYQILRLLHRK